MIPVRQDGQRYRCHLRSGHERHNNQLLMCNDDSKCHHACWCASDPQPQRLFRNGFRTASQLLGKWVVMGGGSIHPRYRLECARTGEGSLIRGASRPGGRSAQVDRSQRGGVEVLPLHSLLFFRHAVQRRKWCQDTERKKQRWLVSSLRGVDIVPYPARAPGENEACRQRFLGLPPRPALT